MYAVGKIIYYLSILSPLFPLFIGRQEKTLIWSYVLTGFMFDIASVSGRMMEHPLPWLGNIFLIAELWFILVYYSRSFNITRYIYYIGSILCLCLIIHTLFIRPNNSGIPIQRLRLNLTAGALFYLLYIVLGVIGFYKLITGPLVDDILKSRRFWINVAFLIYASGVFFMFMFAERIRTQDIKLGALLWGTVFCSLNIIKNMLLAKALSVNDGAVEP